MHPIPILTEVTVTIVKIWKQLPKCTSFNEWRNYNIYLHSGKLRNKE